MADAFRIIPPQVRAEGKDVPPEQIQAGFNALANQTTAALNSVASDPTGPAGGDLSGNYPNPTVSGVNGSPAGTMANQNANAVAITGGTIAGVTVSTSAAIGVTSGGTGQNALNAHNVIIGEGSSAVGFAAPGTAGQILASTGATTDPSFQTKGALAIASSGANSDITSLTGLTTALSVGQGGTGRQTLTTHGVLIGEAAAAINQTTAGTAGQALVSGGASADPAFGVAGVNGGGTGLAILTAHAVLLGEGTSNVGAVGPGTTGQMLIGVTGADPAFGNTVSTLNATGLITPTSTVGIAGTTTNDNAQAGSVGEYTFASPAAIGLTSGTAANVTSISLTAGDWDVTGNVYLLVTATGPMTAAIAGASTTSAALPAIPLYSQSGNLSVANSGAWTEIIPTQRFSLTATTTVFLVAEAIFTGSVTAQGILRARRIR